jgi:hypothetical protein
MRRGLLRLSRRRTSIAPNAQASQSRCVAAPLWSAAGLGVPPSSTAAGPGAPPLSAGALGVPLLSIAAKFCKRRVASVRTESTRCISNDFAAQHSPSNSMKFATTSRARSAYGPPRAPAEVAPGRAIASLASDGGSQSTLWAGPEAISRAMKSARAPVQGTMRKKSVALKHNRPWSSN